MGSSQSFIDACSAGNLETAQDLLANKIVWFVVFLAPSGVNQ
jgi:hypothetical protein